MMEGGRAKLEAWSHTLGPGKGGKKTGRISRMICLSRISHSDDTCSHIIREFL